MENIAYGIAQLKYSKGDLYVVKLIQQFDTFEQANAVFIAESYADAGGGTFQEAYEYKLVDIKNGEMYYHGGGKISTVFD